MPLCWVWGPGIAVLWICPGSVRLRGCDQVIREDPAGAVVVRAWPRGTETSAEVLVGPPWRMVSNAGQQQWYGGYPCTPDGGPMGHSARSTVHPPHPPLQSASEGIGGARGLGNLVRPESSK